MKPEDILVVIVKEHKIVNVSPEAMRLLLASIGLVSDSSRYIPRKRPFKKTTRRTGSQRYEKIHDKEGYERK